jgi:uncharacterized protein (DUF433 family)
MNTHDERITVNPDQMGGVPYIRGLRIPAATVVAMGADRMVREDILGAYPGLQPEDIEAALEYVRRRSRRDMD